MPMSNPERYPGSCACGSVLFEVTGALSEVTFCHCTQCQKSSGHYVAATSASLAKFNLIQDKSLVWFKSSEQAKRGFCSVCGSNLFWKINKEEEISIWPGAFDGPIDFQAKEHIFMSSKAGYYDIKDSLPKHDYFPGYKTPTDKYSLKRK